MLRRRADLHDRLALGPRPSATHVGAWRPADRDHGPARLPLGRAVRSLELKPERDFVRSEFYNEVVRPNGDFHGVVALVRQTTDRTAATSPSAGSWARRTLPTATSRHFRRSCPTLPARWSSAGRWAAPIRGSDDLRFDDAMAVFDRIDLGLILCDAEGRPAYLNRRADALVARPPTGSPARAGRHLPRCCREETTPAASVRRPWLRRPARLVPASTPRPAPHSRDPDADRRPIPTRTPCCIRPVIAAEESKKRDLARAPPDRDDVRSSVQVLQEFYVQATRASRPDPLPHDIAVGLIRTWPASRSRRTPSRS